MTPEQLVSWSATGADLVPPGFEGPGQDAVTFDRTGSVTRLVFLSSC